MIPPTPASESINCLYPSCLSILLFALCQESVYFSRATNDFIVWSDHHRGQLPFTSEWIRIFSEWQIIDRMPGKIILELTSQGAKSRIKDRKLTLACNTATAEWVRTAGVLSLTRTCMCVVMFVFFWPGRVDVWVRSIFANKMPRCLLCSLAVSFVISFLRMC